MIDWIARHVTWPRTLLWRTFLLIVLLVAIFFVSWTQISRYYAMRSRATQGAQMLVSMVNLTRAALIAADDSQRFALLNNLNSLEGIQVLPAESTDKVVRMPDSSSSRLLRETVRKRLGNDTRFAVEVNGHEGFFLSFRVDLDDPEDEYWLIFPKDRLAVPLVAEWIGWGALAALVALLAAYLLVLGLNRPLQALEAAARSIGRGATPPPLHEQGAREIVAVARAFNQMSRDLSELDSDRALILAGVSHDLRTPLARLRLGIELSGAQEEDIQAMGQDIDEMDRIISQFLDFARGNESEPAMECDIVALIREIVQLFERHAQVRIDTPESLPLLCSQKALRRAITNLVDNARRYAGADKPIDVLLREAGTLVEIEVADRGPGIPEDQVERLKRPFTRLEAARTNVQGSGLGLAIVERIARQHGGTLQLLPRDEGGLRAILQLTARTASQSP
jgi:two-component system osmolarity sensor histidine kinase EnvZ